MAKHEVLSWYRTLQAKLAGYPTYIADIVIFAPLGLLVGFLCGSLGRYLVIGLLLSIGLIWFADYLGLITVHQAAIQNFFGLPSLDSLPTLGQELKAWAHDHVAACIAFGISFLIGWKIGR